VEEEIALWDIQKGKLLKSWSDEQSFYGPISFSPDDKQIAIGGYSDDQIIKIWDVQSKSKLITIGPIDDINNIAFSPDGKTLVTLGFEELRLFDAENGKLIGMQYIQDPEVTSIALSHDGTYLAVTSHIAEYIKVYDTRTGLDTNCLLRLRFGDWDIRLAFSPVENILAAVSRTEGYILLWNVETGQQLKTIVVDIWVEDIVFSPDGKKLAVAGDNLIKLVDVNSGAEIRTIGEIGSNPIWLAFSPDGQKLAGATSDGSFFSWDINNGSLLSAMEYVFNSRFGSYVGYPQIPLAISPNWEFIASSYLQPVLEIRNMDGRKLLTLPFDDHSQISDLFFTPNGNVLVSAHYDGRIRFWNIATGLELPSTIKATNPISQIIVSSDGRLIASLVDGKGVVVWGIKPK
jgi:WD40 repeat protein